MPKPCPALRKPCSLQRAGFSSLRVWQDGGRVNLAQGRTRGDRPKGGSHGARVHRCVSGQRNNSGTSGGAGLSFCDERALGARPHQWPVGKRVQAVHDVPTSAFRLILSVGTRALPAAISACGQMQIWGTADIGARYRASDASEGRSEGAWRGGALPNHGARRWPTGMQTMQTKRAVWNPGSACRRTAPLQPELAVHKVSRSIPTSGSSLSSAPPAGRRAGDPRLRASARTQGPCSGPVQRVQWDGFQPFIPAMSLDPWVVPLVSADRLVRLG